jgi:hypothetical protein
MDVVPMRQLNVVKVISLLGIGQDGSSFTAGTVNGPHRIPVIAEYCWPRNVGRRT